jgi:hypothetical protein
MVNTTKFLLISPPRVGSQVLLSSLQDKNNTYFNEIFTHAKYTRKFRGNVKGRFKKPINYINFFLNPCTTKVCGAKILGPSFPQDAMEKVIKSHRYYIIYMFRRNLMENAFSLSIASQTGMWAFNKNKHKNSGFKNFKIDVDKFEGRLYRIFNCTKMCLDLLDKYKPKHKIILYEDFFQNNKLNINCINKVRDFIGLSKIDRFEPYFVKQNNDSTYLKVLNKNVLEKKFSKYGKLNDKISTPDIWKEYDISI